MNQIDKINMDQITKQMSPKLGIDPLVIKNVLARIGLDVVFNEAERLKSSDNFSLMANKSNLKRLGIRSYQKANSLISFSLFLFR